MAMPRTVVDDFQTIVTQLIQEAAAYVAAGESDPETESNIRKLRVLSTALNAALQSVQFLPPRVMIPSS